MKKLLKVISLFLILFYFSSCEKNYQGIKNDDFKEDSARLSSSRVPPLVIYSPVGCNYPTYLGRVFSVNNGGSSSPFPACANPPKFVIFHAGSFFQYLNAGVNPYTHEWEAGCPTTSWPVGSYVVKFMPDPTNPTYLLGNYSFTFVSPGSGWAICW